MDHDSSHSTSASADRLVEALRRSAAAAGPGARMPSSRELVRTHRVSPVTVASAVATLVGDGTLVTERGHGTFVAARPRRAGGDVDWQRSVLPHGLDDSPMAALSVDAGPQHLLLNAGYLSPDLQPRAALTAAAGRAMRRPHAWDRAPLTGLPELCALFAAPLGLADAEVTIVPGSQAGLAAVFRALASPGAAVLLEEPGYPGARVAAGAAGLLAHPVVGDARGLRPEALDDALGRTGAGVVYCQPLLANPTGVSLAEERRAEVLAVLRDRRAFLVEDDWARDLMLDGHAARPLVADDPDGHVVHLRSLTKCVAPSLRVAAVAARGPALQRIRAQRAAEDFFVARPMQEVAVELLGSPAFGRHLRQLHRSLRLRRSALLEALASQLPQVEVAEVPAGGLHLWVRLAGSAASGAVDSSELARRAAAVGVAVGDGASFYCAAPRRDRLRLSFGAGDEQQLRTGVARLSVVMTGVEQPPSRADNGR